MLKARCIAKARGKNNKIVGYKLQDQQGNITIVKPEALKSAIKYNKIEITNLTLTSDNRLVDTSENQDKAPKVPAKTNSKVKQTAEVKKLTLSKEILDNLRVDKFKETSIDNSIANKLVNLHSFSATGGVTGGITGGVTGGITGEMVYFSIFGKCPNIKSANTNIKGINYIYTKVGSNKLLAIMPSSKNIELSLPEYIGDRTVFGDKTNKLFSKLLDNVKKLAGVCDSNIALKIDKVDCSKVIRADNAFANVALCSVEINDCQAPKLVNCYGMFSNNKIVYINIDNFKVPNIVRATEMFRSCNISNASMLKISGLKLDKTKFMWHMIPNSLGIGDIVNTLKNCGAKAAIIKRDVINSKIIINKDNYAEYRDEIQKVLKVNGRKAKADDKSKPDIPRCSAKALNAFKEWVYKNT